MTFDPLTNRRQQYGTADAITEIWASIPDDSEMSPEEFVKHDENMADANESIRELALELVELVNAERAWRGQRELNETTTAEFYRTTYTFTVLHDEPIHPHMELPDVLRECEEGAFVNADVASATEMITGRQMADALYAAGSTPEFFGLDEEGDAEDRPRTDEENDRALVRDIDRLLAHLRDRIEGTNRMCGLEDVLDRWDPFADDANWEHEATPAAAATPFTEMAGRSRALRSALEAESISYGELAEIDSLADELGVTVTDEMLADDTLDEIDTKLAQEATKHESEG